MFYFFILNRNTKTPIQKIDDDNLTNPYAVDAEGHSGNRTNPLYVSADVVDTLPNDSHNTTDGSNHEDERNSIDSQEFTQANETALEESSKPSPIYAVVDKSKKTFKGDSQKTLSEEMETVTTVNGVNIQSNQSITFSKDALHDKHTDSKNTE